MRSLPLHFPDAAFQCELIDFGRALLSRWPVLISGVMVSLFVGFRTPLSRILPPPHQSIFESISIHITTGLSSCISLHIHLHGWRLRNPSFARWCPTLRIAPASRCLVSICAVIAMRVSPPCFARQGGTAFLTRLRQSSHGFFFLPVGTSSLGADFSSVSSTSSLGVGFLTGGSSSNLDLGLSAGLLDLGS